MPLPQSDGASTAARQDKMIALLEAIMPYPLIGLTELTAPDASDWIGVWDVAANLLKKVKRSNLIGAFITGGGTLALGGFTLTVPATGTVDLIGTAQTVSALKTFSAGISLGNETMSVYDEGTWTPVLKFGGGVTGITYTTQTGFYIHIGKLIFIRAILALSNKGSSTGAVTITGAPAGVTDEFTPVTLYIEQITGLAAGKDVQALLKNGITTVYGQYIGAATAALTDAAFTNTSYIALAGCYRMA